MDEGKVEESCETDGDGEDEEGVEYKEERGVRPVHEQVEGHVLRADFGELVEAQVEECKDARRRTEGGRGGVGATSSHYGIAATCGDGSGATATASISVRSTTHLAKLCPICGNYKKIQGMTRELGSRIPDRSEL